MDDHEMDARAELIARTANAGNNWFQPDLMAEFDIEVRPGDVIKVDDGAFVFVSHDQGRFTVRSAVFWVTEDGDERVNLVTHRAGDLRADWTPGAAAGGFRAHATNLEAYADAKRLAEQARAHREAAERA